MPHEILVCSLRVQFDFRFLLVYDNSLGFKNGVLIGLSREVVEQGCLIYREGSQSDMRVIIRKNTIIRQSSWSLTLVDCLDKSEEGLVGERLFVALLVLRE